MLLPTKDKELRNRLSNLFEVTFFGRSYLSDNLKTQILEVVEDSGYYKGLPSSIEETLN